MSSGTTKTVTLNIVGNSSSGQKAVKDLADKSESASGRIAGAFKSSLGMLGGIAGGAFEPISAVVDQLDGKFEGLKLKIGDVGKAMLAGGAGIAGAGAALTALGSGEQQAQQQLAQAIANTGGSFDDYKDKIEKTAKSMAKYGATSAQVDGALQTLTQATNDPQKALDMLSTAANLAAAKHESLGQASLQLSQIIGGKGTRTLSEFGITLQKTTKGTTDHTAAIDALAKKINGQANAASDTFKGKLDALKATVENNVAAFGQKYGPALTAAGAGMSVLGAVTEGATAILGKFKTAQEVSTVATEAMTVASDEAAVSEGLALGPIILIIAGIAALGVGIYELVKHWSTVWGTIKAVVSDAWHFIDNTFIKPIQDAFAAVVGFIQRHWQLILAIITGPIGLAALFIKEHIDQIAGFFTAIPGRIMSAIGSLVNIGKHIIGDITNGLGDVGGTVEKAFEGLPGRVIKGIGDLSSIGKDIIDSVIGGIDDAINVVNSHIPSVLGHRIFPSLPTIPMLADGGTIFSGGIAVVGERGPEMVTLPAGATVHPHGSHVGVAGAGGGETYTIEVPVVIDARQVAKATARFTRDELIRSSRNYRQTGLA